MNDHERFRRLQHEAEAVGLEIGHVHGDDYSIDVKRDPLVDGIYSLDCIEEMVLERRLALLRSLRDARARISG